MKTKDIEPVLSSADYQAEIKRLNLKILNIADEFKKFKIEVVESSIKYIELLQPLAVDNVAIIQKFQLELRNKTLEEIELLTCMIGTIKHLWYDKKEYELCGGVAKNIADCLSIISISEKTGIDAKIREEIIYTRDTMTEFFYDTLAIVDKSAEPLNEIPEFNSLMRFINMMEGTFSNYFEIIDNMDIEEFKLPELKFTEQLEMKTASETNQVQEAA